MIHVGQSRSQERSVWGIDCYTRGNVEHVLDLTLGLSRERARDFIQRSLLPALNRQTGPEGVDMLPALRDLVHGESGGPKARGEHMLAAKTLLDAIQGWVADREGFVDSVAWVLLWR